MREIKIVLEVLDEEGHALIKEINYSDDLIKFKSKK